MKKLFFYVIAFFLLSNPFRAQNLEGPAFKEKQMQPIGELNGFLYYYHIDSQKLKMRLCIYKYDANTLEEVEVKKIFLPQQIGYDFPVEPKIIGNNFYFFYYGWKTNYRDVRLCVFNDFFSNEIYPDLGDLTKNIDVEKFSFDVFLSPDKKNVLIEIKLFCDKFKPDISSALDLNFVAKTNCEDITLLYFNTQSNEVKMMKKLPIEMDGLRLKSSQFKIDNSNNVTFIASIAKIKNKNNTIEATSTATLKNDEEKIKINELKLGDTKKISSYLTQLKNGDIVYFGFLDSKILFRFIPTDKTKPEFETVFSNADFMKANVDTDVVYNISECETGYYLSILDKYKAGMVDKYQTIRTAFVDKNGKLMWYKTFPTVKKVYAGTGFYYKLPLVFSYNNKNYVCIIENKPYEETKQVLKALKKAELIYVSKNEKFNSTLFSIDANGNMKKEIIHDNALILGNPLPDNIVSDKGYFILPLGLGYYTQLKKIYLK